MNKTNFDQLGRPIQDLRISVIDRCNYRCTYCMPKDQYHKNYTFLQPTQWLSFDEIKRIVKQFAACGVNKVRLTGGEPLLRPNLHKLIKDLKKIEGIDDIALTTNGELLYKYVRQLKAAGLNRITISLDAIDPKIFSSMSGDRGHLANVLSSIKSCEHHGFDSLKFNVVIQKGVNENQIMPLIERFRYTKHVLRFIEYMDVGTCNHWNRDLVMTSKEIINLINKKYVLKSTGSNYFGEVAQRYYFTDGHGEIGFISSISQPFCGSCTRARLSTDGKMYNCLFASQGFDLRPFLKSNESDTSLRSAIQSNWRKRSDRYSELRNSHQNTAAKSRIEMFEIGG